MIVIQMSNILSKFTKKIINLLP